MDKPAVWVGVDVSKEELVVALRPSGEQFSLANDGRALRSLIKRLAPLNCARIVVEATGGYETLLVGGKCCNFENGDGGRPERNWAARSQAARSNSWSMN